MRFARRRLKRRFVSWPGLCMYCSVTPWRTQYRPCHRAITFPDVRLRSQPSWWSGAGPSSDGVWTAAPGGAPVVLAELCDRGLSSPWTVDIAALSDEAPTGEVEIGTARWRGNRCSGRHNVPQK